MRKYRSAVSFKCIKVGDTQVVVYITDDLSDEELQQHMDRAIDRGDFEYCAALSAEAQGRSIHLQINDSASKG